MICKYVNATIVLLWEKSMFMLFYGYKIAPGDTAELRIWLSLVSVRHHGRSCNSVKLSKISPRVQAPFSLCTSYVATNSFNERFWKYTEARYWVCWLVNCVNTRPYENGPWIRNFVQQSQTRNRGDHTAKKRTISAVSARACIRAWDLKVMRALGSHPRPLSCNLIDFELL